MPTKNRGDAGPTRRPGDSNDGATGGAPIVDIGAVDTAADGAAGTGGDSGDSGTGGGGTGGGTAKRKRGRPPGSGSKAAAPRPHPSSLDLSGVYLAAHTILGIVTRDRELWDLSDQDIAKLAAADMRLLPHLPPWFLEIAQPGLDISAVLALHYAVYSQHRAAVRAQRAGAANGVAPGFPAIRPIAAPPRLDA